jgi:hypothetical protein
VATVRTFIDSGVLIAAARGTDEVSKMAFEILDDPDRVFITSDFVRLEVLPKSVFYDKADEADFYRAFFDGATETVESSHDLVSEAQSEAEKTGLSAVDALHVAAARVGQTEQLVTTEKSTKPLFRVAGMDVKSIRK